MKTLITLVWLMLFISISFGQSFSVLSIEHRWPDSLKGLQDNVKCILVKDGIIFVGTDSKYLWFSSDTGKSWSQRNWRHGLDAPFGTIFDLKATPSGKILAAAEARTYASTDNGNSWQPIFNKSFTCFLISQSGVIFAGFEGIYRSTNDGLTWTKIVDTSLAGGVWRMVQTPAGIILAGNLSPFLQQAKGIIRSTDNGQSWNFANNGLSGWALSVMDLACYPFGSEEVFLASYAAGVYKSTDSGLNWYKVHEVLESYAKAVGIFPSLGIFIGATGTVNNQWRRSLYRVQGNSWERLAPEVFDNYIVLSFGRYDEKRLLVGTNDGLFLITFTITSVEQTNSFPDFELKQNYPNPFNSSTNIKYIISKNSFVTITLYDIMGREITTLVNEEKEKGVHEIKFDGGKLGLSSGIYFYQMKAGDYTSIKKMVYLK
jgi:hypothetical protein